MDGHALAGLLADHPPASDLAVLHSELAAAARTDARVRRVLEFYAARLSEPDRYLLGAVSLFARPVRATAVLVVAERIDYGWAARAGALRPGWSRSSWTPTRWARWNGSSPSRKPPHRKPPAPSRKIGTDGGLATSTQIRG